MEPSLARNSFGIDCLSWSLLFILVLTVFLSFYGDGLT